MNCKNIHLVRVRRVRSGNVCYFQKFFHDTGSAASMFSPYSQMQEEWQAHKHKQSRQ